MIARGDIRWIDLGEPRGSGPGKRRPVLVIQADPVNASRIRTVVVAVISSNTDLALVPGNVFLPHAVSGLPKDSVINVSQLATVDRYDLEDVPAGFVPADVMRHVDDGLRGMLSL